MLVVLIFLFLKKLKQYTLLLLSWGILTLRTALKFEGNREVDRSKELSKRKWKITCKNQNQYSSGNSN